MPIKISKSLRSEIVDAVQRENIESLLRQKADGRCFLCNGNMNEASEDLEADHDLPTREGGDTSLENLNLVHKRCNRFKKNNPTVLVRNFLSMNEFIDANHDATFADVLKDFYRVTTQPFVITDITPKYFSVDLPNGTSIKKIPINTVAIPGKEKDIHFSYLQIPLNSIYNDDVQPRTVKIKHLFSLYQDLHFNPIHEPSSMRLEGELRVGENKFLMFDGQHKAISKALLEWKKSENMGDVLIDAKIYLNLDRDEATKLVNSIQSKIIKLGLTKTEFAMKMNQEYRAAYEDYEQRCSDDGSIQSEYGFIESRPANERPRATQALFQARRVDVYEDKKGETPLRIRKYIKGSKDAPARIDSHLELKETTFYSKLLDKLLYKKPLKDELDRDDTKRAVERINIRMLLEILVETVFEDDGLDSSAKKRIKSQSGLVLWIDFINRQIEFLLNEKFPENKNTLLLDYDLGQYKEKLTLFSSRFAKHPIWNVEDVNQSVKVAAFYNDLQKNKNIEVHAKEVSLTMPYCAGMDALTGTELL